MPSLSSSLLTAVLSSVRPAGVTWVARKILVKLDVTTTIQQNPEWCSIMDQSSAGESTTKVKTDGNPQTITDAVRQSGYSVRLASCLIPCSGGCSLHPLRAARRQSLWLRCRETTGPVSAVAGVVG